MVYVGIKKSMIIDYIILSLTCHNMAFYSLLILLLSSFRNDDNDNFSSLLRRHTTLMIRDAVTGVGTDLVRL